MTAPTTAPEAAQDKGPLSVRMTPDQRAALEWFVFVFPDRYRGVGSVLEHFSLTQAEDAFRRQAQYSADKETS
jgi:hypothetical protein